MTHPLARVTMQSVLAVALTHYNVSSILCRSEDHPQPTLEKKNQDPTCHVWKTPILICFYYKYIEDKERYSGIGL